MVGIVVVSHSKKICEGISDIVSQMVSNCPLAIAGGLPNGDIGTDTQLVVNAIESVMSDDGILILADLGSAIMCAEMAIELCSNPKLVEIVDGPVVESSIIACVASSLGKTKDEILKEVYKAKASCKIHS